MKYLITLISVLSFANCSVKYKNEVLVKCNDNINCQKVLNSYNFKNSSKLTNKIYLIKLDNTKDAKDISKMLEKNKDIKFAHPNFIKTKKRR